MFSTFVTAVWEPLKDKLDDPHDLAGVRNDVSSWSTCLIYQSVCQGDESTTYTCAPQTHTIESFMLGYPGPIPITPQAQSYIKSRTNYIISQPTIQSYPRTQAQSYPRTQSYSRTNHLISQGPDPTISQAPGPIISQDPIIFQNQSSNLPGPRPNHIPGRVSDPLLSQALIPIPFSCFGSRNH